MRLSRRLLNHSLFASIAFAAASVASLLTSTPAYADDAPLPAEAPAPVARAKPDNDFLFPGSGKISFTGTTGLPFAALGEVSVGLGDRFAAGALVTGGPFLGGIATGINPRVDMLHFGPMRLVLEAPVIWYPDLENTNNWMVTRPDVRLEGRVGHFRIHGSMGLMWAKMIGASPVQGTIAPYGGGGLPSGVQHGDVWNTVGGGAAYALSSRTSVFAEGFVIMRGVDLAGKEWFDFPLGTFVGVSTTL
jgi:hypothetical protein